MKLQQQRTETSVTATRDKTITAQPQNLNIEVLQENLGHCLSIIDDEVMKGYVTKLDTLPIVKLDETALENLNAIHFFRISELVYQEDEFSVDKLSMVFHALSGKPCTLVLMLKSDGIKTDFYLGARPDDDYSAGTLFQMLKQSLMGFFPGSRIEDYYDEDMKKDIDALDVGCISSVTSVADYKQEQDNMTNKEFIQGLEKFVYAVHGKAYTAMFIANNLSYDELMFRKREYEQIYTQISPFANMQMSFMVTDGTSTSTGSSEGKTTNLSKTKTSGTSTTTTNSVTDTNGTSDTVGTSETKTAGESESTSDGTSHTKGKADTEVTTKTVGANVGFGGKDGGFSAGASYSVSKSKGHTTSVSDSVSKTLTHGFSNSTSIGTSKTHGTNQSQSLSKSSGTGTNESSAYTYGESFNLVDTQTLTDSFGTSKGVTLNTQNMTLTLILQRLQKQLERIEECESFGMWNFAAYFLGETAAETETAANTYKSVISGTDSGLEAQAINSWHNDEMIHDILPYLQNFLHPKFSYSGFSYDGARNIPVDPSALVSTNELAIHMGLPRHSVIGLPVSEHAAFGQEVVTRRTDKKNNINIGIVYNFGRETEAAVDLDLNNLSMHTFVTGSTGSGKSNAVYNLLNEVRKKGIPFLVVEPAKGEYKTVFSDVKCFGTNPLMGELLRIDPFSFPKGIHVLEHIDRIIEIFNVCWPMYAAMPAVLKESIENAYRTAGWDLDMSVNEKIDGLFPTFDDVLSELEKTIKSSAYSSDAKGDYIGSLSTRLRSLTNGINGRIFVSDEMDLAELFDKSAIIDISRVGSTETKSLIMGLVVMKLQEYRVTNSNGMNLPLRHITVLEEAHNLLKKTSTEQSAESSNMVGKSVEMLTNAIAEIRTYGEGFIIVDQAPNLLDTAVIRNTNTKIVLRLPESSDRETTGGAIALEDKQFNELSKLPTGVAAVYQNDWQEAVLCKMPKYEPYYFSRSKQKANLPTMTKKKTEIDALLHILIKRDTSQIDQAELKGRVMRSNISAKSKKEILLNWNRRNLAYEWAVAELIKKNYDLSDVFNGTNEIGWDRFSQLNAIMRDNLQSEFEGFSNEEMYTVMYYVCRIEHKIYPKEPIIETLRVKYLKERAF